MGGFWCCCAVPAIGYSRLVCPCVAGWTNTAGSQDTHPSLTSQATTYAACVWMGYVCKAAAYHEYVTEPFIHRAYQAHLSPSPPCLPAQRTFFRPGSKGETDPSERKTVRSRPGGPRLDWVLCISYLAIISGGSGHGGRKRFHCPLEGRSKVSQADQASKATQHSNTAHVGRGREGAGLSLSLSVET